jgi:sarcosine oxidase subunit gamma
MGYELTIQRPGLNAVIDLQGSSQAIGNWVTNGLPPFPDKPNSSSSSDGLALYWVAPERWLLRSTIDNEDRMLEITRPASAPVDISVVQVSDAFSFFRIIGPDAGEIISTACPIDHHISVFPHNGVSYTSIFGIKGLLLRVENGFEIAVEASFADMISDYLARATG